MHLTQKHRPHIALCSLQGMSEPGAIGAHGARLVPDVVAQVAAVPRGHADPAAARAAQRSHARGGGPIGDDPVV